MRRVTPPTPADEHVDDEVSVLGEDDNEQGVEVQTLHQQPEEVGHDEVLEENQAGFTSHLRGTKKKMFVERAQQLKVTETQDLNPERLNVKCQKAEIL